MFSTSTQCKHWTFASEAELEKLRGEANVNHIVKFRSTAPLPEVSITYI